MTLNLFTMSNMNNQENGLTTIKLINDSIITNPQAIQVGNFTDKMGPVNQIV